MDALAAIDAEETRLLTELAAVRTTKATLRRVLGAAEPPHGPLVTPAAEPAALPAPVAEPPPGKPQPRPAPTAPGVADAAPLAVRIALHLLGHGPQRVRQMVDAGVGLQPKINAAMAGSPWFRKAGPNLKDPWVLTGEGRAAAAEAADQTSATLPTSGPASAPAASSSCTPTPSPA